MKKMMILGSLLAMSATPALANGGSFVCKTSDGIVLSANLSGELDTSNFKVKRGKRVEQLTTEEISLHDGRFSVQAAIVTEGDDFETYRVDARAQKNGVYRGTLEVNAGEIFEKTRTVNCSVKFVAAP